MVLNLSLGNFTKREAQAATALAAPVAFVFLFDFFAKGQDYAQKESSREKHAFSSEDIQPPRLTRKATSE